MNRPAQILLICVAACWFGSGCTIGPDHDPSRLRSVVPPAASESAGSDLAWAAAQPSAHLPRGEWWTVFQDPALDRLEREAMAGNPGLVVARSRVEEARAMAGIIRAGSLPEVSFKPAASRQRTSENSFDRGGAAGVSHTFSSFLLPLEAGWEPDLWGRVRRLSEGASARIEASQDDFESARLAVQAEIAVHYLALRSHEAELELLRRMATAFARSLELNRNRKAGGVATELDVARAETQLRGVESEIPAVERQRGMRLHALAALCGANPLSFQIPAGKQSSGRTPVLPESLAADLLERRPDIAAAERRVAEANAEVGVARSAFFPRFRIHGLAGLQSIDAGTLFNAPSRVWAIGPAMELPVFTGGRNRSGLLAAKARFETASAEYRTVVLNAFREVADQLTALRRLQEQLMAVGLAAEAAGRTLQIAENRYRAGLVTYLEVATAQNESLAQQRTRTRLEGELQLASVGLIRSLGGGWQQVETKRP